MVLLIEVSGASYAGSVGAFATGSELGELQGVAEYMLLPIGISVFISWVLLGVWRVDLQPKLRLALSVALGPLVATIGCATVITAYQTIADDVYKLSTTSTVILRLFLFVTLLCPPTLIVLGPILTICLLRVRRGETLPLANFALYGASGLAVLLEYAWLRFALSG